MGLLKKVILVILSAWLLPKIYFYFSLRGVGVVHFNHYPGKCQVILGVECGAESIATTNDGLAFFSSGFRGMTNCNKAYLKGKIYLFDFNNPTLEAVEMVIESDTIEATSFDPHGIDIIESEGTVKIFVVNHANHEESIEVLLFDRQKPKVLKHVQTIRDEKFVCLNDITLVGESSFYVTNYVKYCAWSKHAYAIEIILKLNTANIVYWEGGKTRIVVEIGPSFNGIALSKDKSKVFTVSSSNMSLHVFSRSSTGDLSPASTILISAALDNVYIDKETGYLYLGVFKTPFLGLSATKNKTLSSSTGLRLIPTTSEWKDAEIVELFHDNGELVHSASMFVHYQKRYLVGSIFNTLVYCDDRKM